MTTQNVLFRKGGRAFLSLLLPLSMLLSFNSYAQDVPRLITYQGQINSSSGAVSGEHTITASLYESPGSTTPIWQGSYSTIVTDGIFAVVLGAGKYPLPELAKLGRELWVGISVDGGEELRPLTQLTSSPYALNVPDKSITKAKLSDDVLAGMVGKGQDPQAATGFDELTTNTNTSATMTVGNGASLIPDGSGGIVKANRFAKDGVSTSNDVDLATSEVNGILPDANGGTGSSNGAWILGGNTLASTTAGTHWLGSNSSGSGNKEIWIKTNDQVVMRYAPNSTNTPNIIGGYSGNTIANIGIGYYSLGAVIAGGGYAYHPNIIGNRFTSDYAIIGGGYDNKIEGIGSAIVGGINNQIFGSPDEYVFKLSFIGGGEGNLVVGDYSVVNGGYDNHVENDGTASYPSERIHSDYSVIAGGESNTIWANHSAILGGKGLKLIGDNSFGFRGANLGTVTVANANTGYLGNIDLWLANDDNISHQLRFYEASSNGSNYTSFQAVAQSNDINYILPPAQGVANSVLQNDGSGNLSWGVGFGNDWHISGNTGTTAGANYLGTTDNQPFEIHIYETDAANKGSKRVMRFEPNAYSANIIGGYSGNTITNSFGSYIGGGGESAYLNAIDHGSESVICGGVGNVINGASFVVSPYSFMGGGLLNTITANHAVICGGDDNVASGSLSFIGGGGDATSLGGNTASGQVTVVVGGEDNTSSGDFSTIVGGVSNNAVGEFSFVGGGQDNQASNKGAGVSFGRTNLAQGYYSFIGGGGDTTISGTLSQNKTTGIYDVIVGGQGNQTLVASSVAQSHTFIGGGFMNSSQSLLGVIGGGSTNAINTNSPGSSILGGTVNAISAAQATIGGGTQNTITSAGLSATIPGGTDLQAQSFGQTVIGVHNKRQGSATAGNFFTTNANDRIFIIGNGPSGGSLTNAYEVSNNGHSIVYHNNGGTNSAISGARYIDNTPIAWGRFSGGVLTSSFGVDAGSTVRTGLGQYKIRLNYTDPYSTSQVSTINASCPIATIEGGENTYNCYFINTSPISIVSGRYQFWVRISQNVFNTDHLDCVATDGDFFFAVFARP